VLAALKSGFDLMAEILTVLFGVLRLATEAFFMSWALDRHCTSLQRKRASHLVTRDQGDAQKIFRVNAGDLAYTEKRVYNDPDMTLDRCGILGLEHSPLPR
jgi:hypothetical protein